MQLTAYLQLIFLIAITVKAFAADHCAQLGYGNATTTPELTQGPYHTEDIIFRANVTDGEEGTPLQLTLTLLDTECLPIADAIVEVWHANATGYYSGIANQSPGNGFATTGEENEETNFLRGMTQTDNNGVAEFYTIFPGIYMGRAMHIHYGVHIVTNNTGTEAEDFEDSYLTHIGQIFFEDALVEEVGTYAPYSATASETRTYLATDNVYTGDTNTIANVSVSYPDHFQWGSTASVEVIVDPETVDSFRASGSSGGMVGGAMGPRPEGMGAGMVGMAGDSGPLPLPTQQEGIVATAGRRLLFDL